MRKKKREINRLIKELGLDAKDPETMEIRIR
jgi:hypothetical protein